jgi:hypothetical protein
MSQGTPKLFEQNLNGEPSDEKRLAYGEPSAISENMTFGQLKTLLRNGLGILLQSNNLSDVDAAKARDNLSVLSEDEIDTLFSGVATLLDPGSGQVPGINNTVNWSITSPYQPVHKTYVDNVFSNAIGIGFTGTATSGHFNNLDIKGRKFGKVLQVIAEWNNTEWGSSKFMKRISGYTNPGYQVPLIATMPDLNANRISKGYIDTDGSIYFTNDQDNLDWQLNAFVVMG